MYDNNVITSYEMTYISNLATSVGTPTTPLATVVSNFQTLMTQIENDTQVTSPTLRATISVGLASAQNGLNPPPFYPDTINWGNAWSDDLSGAGVGATIGAFSGPGGAAIGAGAGGVIATGVSILIGSLCGS